MYKRELDGSNIATALRSAYIPKSNATAVPFGPKQQVRIYVYIYKLNDALLFKNQIFKENWNFKSNDENSGFISSEG